MSDLPPDGPGLYFLVKDETVIYVGSSLWPSRRVYNHAHTKGKDFDREFFLAVPEGDDLLAAERHWIRTLCPRHNKAHNPRPDPSAPGWGSAPSDTETTRISSEFMKMARVIANLRGISVPRYLTELLEPIVQAEYSRVVHEMAAEIGLSID